MQPLSGDSLAVLHSASAPVLVLRLDPSVSGLSIQLEVVFPQRGKSGICIFSTLDGYTEVALKLPGRPAPGGSSSLDLHGLPRAFILEVLAPFEFSGLGYDPLGSMAASLARLANPANGTGESDAWSGRSNDGLMALWAALEADLYRFAKDPCFTSVLDVAKKEQPGEYRRFARLNDLYRDILKLLVPYGFAPRRWTAWLRGQEYRAVLPGILAMGLEGFLTRGTRRPQEILECLPGLLVRHGALVMTEHD
jgi:hypothetical protein